MVIFVGFDPLFQKERADFPKLTDRKYAARVAHEPEEEGIKPIAKSARIFEASGLEMRHIPKHRTCVLACQDAMETGYNTAKTAHRGRDSQKRGARDEHGKDGSGVSDYRGRKTSHSETFGNDKDGRSRRNQ